MGLSAALTRRAAAVASLIVCGSAGAATFSVNSVSNGADVAPADGICQTATPGQCTLRAAIQSANATVAGAPHTIAFAVPASQLTSGVARIGVTGSDLPAITRAGTAIDGTSAPDTNPGSLGAGGTVGVDALPLPQVGAPDVEIFDGDTRGNGLTVNADAVTIRGLAILGFGSNDVLVNATGTSVTITRNVLGAHAVSWSDPGVADRTTGRGITGGGASGGTISDNLIGWHGTFGILLVPGTSWRITGNEIRRNAILATNLDGLSMEGAGTEGNLVEGNLSTENGGVGIDSYQANGRETIRNNTVTRNGLGTSVATAVESPGIRVYGALNVLSRNIVADNYGAGAMLVSSPGFAASQTRITQNSIFGNGTIANLAGLGPSGQVGIDLHAAGDDPQRGTAPFVTLNDPGDTDTGANDLLNFPVLESAVLDGDDLVISGWARPDVDIELFRASIAGPGFGQGRSYLTTFSEGSATDTDGSVAAYAGLINGIDHGADTTNRFRVTVPGGSLGVSSGDWLTSTATSGASTTSEFSGNVLVTARPVDLVATKSGPATALVGGTATFALAVTNRGPGTATSVQLADALPAEVTPVSASASQGSCATSDATVICALGTLPPGAVATVSVRVTVTTPGSITNTVNVHARQVDAQGSDNSATFTLTASRPATLAIALGAPARVPRGDTFHLRIRVSNTATIGARGVVLRIVLPKGITLVRRPRGARLVRGVIVWPIGAIPPGRRVTRTLVVRMGSRTTGPQLPWGIATGDNVLGDVRARATIRPIGAALSGRVGVTG